MNNTFQKLTFLISFLKLNKFIKYAILYCSSSVFDLIALSLIPLIIGIIIGAETNLLFWNNILPRDWISNIYILSFFLISIYIFKSYFNFFSIKSIIGFVNNAQHKLRIEIFQNYLKKFSDGSNDRKLEKYINNVGYITNVFTENVFLKSILVISEIFIVLIILIFLAFVNFIGFIFLISFFGTFFLLYFFSVRKKLILTGQSQSNSLESLTKVLSNVFNGYKEIKIFNATEYFVNFFENYSDIYKKNNSDFQKITYLPKYLVEAIAISFLLLLALLVSFLSNGNFSDHIGTLAIYLLAFGRIAPLAYNIFSSLAQIVSSKFSIDQLYDELISQQKNTSKDKNNHHIKDMKKVFISDFKSLEFKDVFFKYDKTDSHIFENLNLKIIKGESIGIKGPSGSGKTSLINLILGFLKPNQGEIIINDKYKIDETNLINLISYTPQNFFILENNSIKENIALGVPEDLIDEKKIIFCLEKVNLRSFLVNKDNYLRKEINLSNISGGQLQRICIARALYFNRDFAIFDEFTSSLDIENENIIIDNLEKNFIDKTNLIISHKKNSFKNCDKVFELKNKKLFEV